MAQTSLTNPCLIHEYFRQSYWKKKNIKMKQTNLPEISFEFILTSKVISKVSFFETTSPGINGQ